MRPRTARNNTNNALIGSLVILVATIATLISFSATNGLPFIPTYKVTVEIPDASGVDVGAPVRVGGARVGVVKRLHAVGPTAAHPSFTRAELAIDPKLRPLPIDSRVRLRPISVLGGKYVAIALGTSADGLAKGRPLPLARAAKTVDIGQALRVFEPRTRLALQQTLTGLGNGLAGRGREINAAIASFDHLLAPFGRVADILAAPSTGLARFIRAGAGLARALAPVASQLRGFIAHAGPTLAALRGSDGSLGDAIDQTARLTSVANPALGEIQPVLDDARVVTANLRRAAPRIPAAVRELDATLRAASPSLRLTPGVSRRLRSLFKTLDGFARDRTTVPSLGILRQATDILTPLLEVVTPAQTTCNVFSLAARNLGLDRAQGDANGSFARTALYTYLPQTIQAGHAAADLHADPYATNNANECETGNEPYAPGRVIGSPAGIQPAKTENTRPPAEATARARAAGLLDENPQGAP
jgi:ABC-type transporter Mla subunit MlaD